MQTMLPVSFFTAVLLQVLSRFHRENPAIRLRVSNQSAPEAIDALRSGLAELAVVTMPPTAAAAQVHTGSATILSNVSGTETREYAVQIVSVEPDEPQGRNLRLAVTDSTLLAQTGGIVQGMSGSPILQDGRLVGAVTHVLVNEPAAGYGILIENMLAAAG